MPMVPVSAACQLPRLSTALQSPVHSRLYCDSQLQQTEMMETFQKVALPKYPAQQSVSHPLTVASSRHTWRSQQSKLEAQQPIQSLSPLACCRGSPRHSTGTAKAWCIPSAPVLPRTAKPQPLKRLQQRLQPVMRLRQTVRDLRQQMQHLRRAAACIAVQHSGHTVEAGTMDASMAAGCGGLGVTMPEL